MCSAAGLVLLLLHFGGRRIILERFSFTNKRKRCPVDGLLAFLSVFWKVLFILFFFGFCIFIHEFGHLLAALWRGLYVEKFSLGFGRKLWGFSHRGVEYVISLLPFGGYVMLPQLEPSATPCKGNGERLPESSPLDRICAALAGPLFNLLFGFLLATVMWKVGVWEPAPANSCLVSAVPKILPLYKDGLTPEDEVVAVNGEPVKGYWEEICEELPDSREPLRLTVQRPVKNGDVWQTGKVELVYTPELNPEWQAGVRPGDRLVAVNERTFAQGAEEARQEYVYTREAEVLLDVISRDGQARQLRYTPPPNPQMEYLGFPFFTLQNPVAVGAVRPDSAAARQLVRPGDFLLSLNGETIVSAKDFSERLAAMPEGTALAILVGRSGQERLLQEWPVKSAAIQGAHDLGLVFNVMAAEVVPGMPAARAGVEHGDRLVRLQGEDITDSESFVKMIQGHGGRELELVINRAGEDRLLKLTPVRRGGEGAPLYQIGIVLSGSDPKVIGYPDPWTQFTRIVGTTARTLGLLFSPLTRNVKALFGADADSGEGRPEAQIKVEHMSGPLGIMMMLWYKLKLEGMRGGLSFIILISFSLAMMNLLPLPVLDGGHIVFALLELVTRRKLPVKLVGILQNVFAALLIGLMLYITVFDGKRMYRHGKQLFGGKSVPAAVAAEVETPETSAEGTLPAAGAGE